MSYQAYEDSKKILLLDPPYYGIIAAAAIVATPEQKAKITEAWGKQLRSREFDLKYGIQLVNEHEDWTAEAYLMAAILVSDTNNLWLFDQLFHDLLVERKARYNAPGGRLPEDE